MDLGVVRIELEAFLELINCFLGVALLEIQDEGCKVTAFPHSGFDTRRQYVIYTLSTPGAESPMQKQRDEIADVIPCYNEAVTVGKVVRDFKKVLPSATIHVFDHDSTDHTASAASATGSTAD